MLAKPKPSTPSQYWQNLTKPKLGTPFHYLQNPAKPKLGMPFWLWQNLAKPKSPLPSIVKTWQNLHLLRFGKTWKIKTQHTFLVLARPTKTKTTPSQ
jgi:hypothetical protein